MNWFKILEIMKNVLSLILFLLVVSSVSKAKDNVYFFKVDEACWDMAYHYSLHAAEEYGLTGAQRELIMEEAYESCLE